jgi:hypothetical protein
MCVDMLKVRPDLKKFKGDADAVKNVETAYSSNIFGGSVFLPIGKKNGKRDKKNPLELEIKATQVDYLYGGGYYVLKNVKEEYVTEYDGEEYTAATYWDIYMLVESIEQFEELKKLKIMNDGEVKGTKTKDQKIINFEDVVSSLNGYGRIIKWTCIGDDFSPENNVIQQVVEGKFKEGMMDGYCRMIDASTNEEVHVGYFKEDLPMGKY